MVSATQLQTVASDRVHHQQQLKEALSLVMEQDTDLVIVSEDKQRLPCHSSLLALYSHVVATLLSELPYCCTPPTIFLPDFQATHITTLLHLLRCGQAITGEGVFGDITMMEKMARVLKIPLTINDLNVGTYIDVSFQAKELNGFNVKQDEKENVERLETISVRQEEMEESGLEESPETQIKTEVDQDNPESSVHSTNVHNTNAASLKQEKIPDSFVSIDETCQENSSYDEMITSSINGINPSISFSNEELDHSSILKGEASTHYNRRKFHKINNNDSEIEIMEVYEGKSLEITEAVLKALKKENDDDSPSTEVLPKFACGECNKSFSNAATLLVHTEKHGQIKGKRKCPLCNISGERINIITHIRAIHTKEKLFECSVCQKRFTTCTVKNEHEMRYMSWFHPIENLVRAEKQPKEKLFGCSVCVKKFFSSAMKDIHENTHVYQPKDKQFECSVCRKKFFTSEIKDRHEKAHIYRPKQKLFQCSMCHKKLSSARGKKEHEKRNH